MTTKRRKRHNPEQIVRKLRDADAMLNAKKDMASVLQALEFSDSSCLRNGRQRHNWVIISRDVMYSDVW